MPDLPQTAAFGIACADHPSNPARSDTLHLSVLPRTTKWYRVRGRPTRRENATKQQYLSAREEKTLVKFVLHMSNSNYTVPLKFLRSLAREIRRQRAVTSQALPSKTILRYQVRTGRRASLSDTHWQKLARLAPTMTEEFCRAK